MSDPMVMKAARMIASKSKKELGIALIESFSRCVKLQERADDHALFAAAACKKVVEWCPWYAKKGEVRCGGLLYTTELDEYGVPILHVHLRNEIKKLLGRCP